MGDCTVVVVGWLEGRQQVGEGGKAEESAWIGRDMTMICMVVMDGGCRLMRVR